jgi:peptidoglycan/xylan/chitin deacetylase (PgdA/CDA1 family)
MMNWVLTPTWLKKLFPQMVWEIPAPEKDIYLTFDDGPTPVVTPGVLALLSDYQVKATFFCLGSKIEGNPELFEAIKTAGHTIGNHGYRHINGFTTSSGKYLDNVRKGEELSGSKLFRPPYGRITPRQMNLLRKDYRLVMWSILSMDFDRNLSVEECFNNVVRNVQQGAIILLHDSEKAQKNVLQMLPELLQWMERNGYKAKALEEKFFD